MKNKKKSSGTERNGKSQFMVYMRDDYSMKSIRTPNTNAEKTPSVLISFELLKKSIEDLLK